MAAIDPIAYMRSLPPFAALPKRLFDEVARSIEVVFHPAGTVLVHAGGERLRHLYLVRMGSVRLERDGQTIEVAEEGETFGYTSLITREATLDVVVEEDLLAYRLPEQEFQRLLGDAQFAAHFAVGLGERLKSTLKHSPVATQQPDLSVDVQQLVRGPAVWVDPEATVGEAARIMTEARISSVLVRGDPPGIVTDRDFRNRVLATGLGPRTLVRQVLTQPLKTVAAATPIHDAWTTLLDSGVHHLPITRDGSIIGVVTGTDLLRCTAHGPVKVLRQVEHLASRESLSGYAAQVSQMTGELVAAGLDARIIAGFVARLNDTLMRRILRWAESELGPPPAPYAWIAFGSEGRMEQTLLTDQDNAIVYADEGEGHADWYAKLGERANADLVTAGFPVCRGGYMASRWHEPLSSWQRRFGEWIDSPGPQALLEAAIFFDFRRVAGDLELGPLQDVLDGAARKPNFLRFLARSAMEYHPPPLLLLRLRGQSSRVDLKVHGISPVVFLARCYALEAGARARNTIERLEAATAAKLLDEAMSATIAEAYRFLLGLRLHLQLGTLADGGTPSNEVPLSHLNAVERSRLKDAFRAIRAWHEQATRHFRTTF